MIFMSKDPSHKQRRRLIINKEVQYDVLMYVGLFAGCLFVSQTVAAGLFLYQIRDAIEVMSAKELISHYKVSFWVCQLLSLGTCSLLGVGIFNRLTSRIVGPLYNMQRVLKEQFEEDSPKRVIHLREDDYFKKEMEDVNKLLRKKVD